ncbi:DUF6916 family protein [Clostridium sp. JS66]|nr:hypothetical protein [Clostridium sp. JS66]WPC43961.1 hypothetical protein Q6H37_10925 [Clostridium sp. JS66]
MLENFTIGTFSVGDVFKVFYGEGQHVEITLVQVSASKFKIPNLKREPFFLVFSSNKEIWIETGCYSMEQEKVGNFEMAITPTAPLDGKFNYYEAAFS